MQLNGNVLIACNCDWGCPCNFNARPSRGKCEGGWIWMIDRGEVNRIDVGGLGVALFADWPGAIHEGGGRASSYLDERADPAQRSALATLLNGEAGGPWGLFRKTYDLSGPHPARFDVTLAQHETRAKVGDFVELEMQKILNPVTQA